MSEEPPPGSRESLVAGTTTKLVGALSEPRSFLLFIFAVLAMIEYSNYTRTKVLVETVVGIIGTTNTTISREQDFNRDMMEGMLRIIEADAETYSFQQRLAEHSPPRPYQPAPDPSPTYPR